MPRRSQRHSMSSAAISRLGPPLRAELGLSHGQSLGLSHSTNVVCHGGSHTACNRLAAAKRPGRTLAVWVMGPCWPLEYSDFDG
jgi:hypothetical protein